MEQDRKAGAIASQGGQSQNGADSARYAFGANGPQGESGPMGGVGGGGLAGHSAMGRRQTTSTAGGRDGISADEVLRQSLDAQASGQKAGELFQYNISTPISLPRQQASMIPVIAQDIEADKVSLYNADTDPKYPMNAIRLHNTTTLHLKGGPVTLFDAGVYAGDARMEDVPPGDSRLITYAVDLSLICERQNPTVSSNETTVMVKRGVLTTNQLFRTETTYTIKSKADKPRNVLVEHPFDSGSTLVSPAKAEERTASLYRFPLTVKPGESQTLKVVTERPIAQEFVVLDGNMDAILVISNRKNVSPKLKAELQEVVQRRKHVDELKSAATARGNEVTSIGNDQERIRKNMEALDKASALYKRYVSELDLQESKIETLRQEAIKLNADALAATLDLKVFVEGITE